MINEFSFLFVDRRPRRDPCLGLRIKFFFSNILLYYSSPCSQTLSLRCFWRRNNKAAANKQKFALCLFVIVVCSACCFCNSLIHSFTCLTFFCFCLCFCLLVVVALLLLFFFFFGSLLLLLLLLLLGRVLRLLAPLDLAHWRKSALCVCVYKIFNRANLKRTLASARAAPAAT